MADKETHAPNAPVKSGKQNADDRQARQAQKLRDNLKRRRETTDRAAKPKAIKNTERF